MSNKLFISFFVLVFLFLNLVLASDLYKPYLHEPSVPDHPELKLYGEYQTNLFPGAATYSFPIEVPKGINGFSPSIILSYNSQNAKYRPSVMGSGWYFHKDFIYRDINGTPDNLNDDEFIMILDLTPYNLKFNPTNNKWNTEVQYHIKIENITENGVMYWLVTKRDGTKYRYGFNDDSRTTSERGFISKWDLDLVEDTHSNKIYYTYEQNPFGGDYGSNYLTKVEYNNDKTKVITFSYEDSVREDYRVSYEHGTKVSESRRLTDISVYSDFLIRRYHLDYSSLGSSLSSISKISSFGSDNTSLFYDIDFTYYELVNNFTKNTSTWVPPVIFSATTNDYGVRLLDVNNDGFVDIVKYIDVGENKIWINNHKDGWNLSTQTLPIPTVSSSYVDLGVRFSDVNNDGFIDIVRSRAGYMQIYLGNGINWTISSWIFPLDIVSSSGVDQGVQLDDINGDGRVDIIQSKSGITKTVYLNNGTGWYLSDWSIPEYFVDASGDTGARLVDLNSDGLIDLLYSNSRAYINNGTAFVQNNTWTSPVAIINGDRSDAGVRLFDVNGDGLVDILVQNTACYLNTGSGFIQNDSWKSTESFVENTYNSGRRIADVNGDGFADIVVSISGSQYTVLKNYEVPYLLKNITNEYGGVTSIEYSTSTSYNNSENGVSELGFNIFVVSNVTLDNKSITKYNYSFGKYNYSESEFRGFGKSSETNDYSRIIHYFYQDSARHGKEYKTESYDLNDNLFFRNVKYYNYTLDYNSYNLSLAYSTDYVFDGLSTPTVKNESYKYDSHENILEVYSKGSDVAKITKYTYAYNSIPWIIDKPSSSALYDSNLNKIQETKYYYDSLGLNGISKGDLTKVEKWSADGNNSYIYYDYDSFGNVIRVTDALGYSTKYIYDSSNTYATTTINPLGHVSTFEYDNFGNLLWSKTNNIKTIYIYDVFGRISKEIKPYDSESLPTKTYTYNLNPESINVKFKTTSNNTDSVTYYYDGFGDLVQVKSDVENGRQVVKNLFYDSNFRVSRESNLYFDNYSASMSTPKSSPYTTYTYDSMDRVTKVTNPDNTSKQVLYSQYNITDYDENGHRHKYVLDAFGRIVKVVEYNIDGLTGIEDAYTTTYSYDTADNLIQITDALGNKFGFTYDSFGRKTAISDPDLGVWTYSYDKNNNLIKQTDNRGMTTSLSYDALNRVLNKKSNDVNVSFVYDKNYVGTLSSVSMKNKINSVVYNYSYDDRLRLVNEKKNLNNQIDNTNYLYDSQDRLLANSNLSFYYNKLGKVRKITGFLDSNFNAIGSLSNRTFNNEIVTQFVYDKNNNRLKQILSEIQNYTYSYDNVGNIISINDYLSSRIQNMTYDGLDRLSTVKINNDRYSYSFNAIGNILKIQKNNASKKLIYGGSLAHAPSQVIDSIAGVDLHNPHEISSDNKNRTYEFYLVNEKDSNLTGVNFSVDFGDGHIMTSTQSINLSGNSVWVIVENNYSHGGDYEVSFNASSPETKDSQKIESKFGLTESSLSVIYSNISLYMFDYILGKNINENVKNLRFNCSNGVNSSTFDLITSELLSFLQIDYSSSGVKNLICNATSDDGEISSTITFTIKGLEINNYDILSENVSKQVVEFWAKNNYYPLMTNISIDTGVESFSKEVNISSGESIMVISEVNYSSDDTNKFEINLDSDESSQSYVNTFKTQGVSIEDYMRSDSVLFFNVRNNWYPTNVSWSVANLNESTYLENDQLLFVMIEKNSTENSIITAKANIFTDMIVDTVHFKPLEISLFENLFGNVFEIDVQNNIEGNQTFDLTLDDINVQNLNVTNSTIIFIEGNYSSGIFETNAYVNNSEYSDSINGVVVNE
ncbi:VCBS repeat-containing protein [Candidatus Woesearchaeota archaeon]|nr:VCBS repeat-containing protein [Candidatus Woesearchaeota archaeon]